MILSHKKTNQKCIKCLKLFGNRHKKVECKEYENILHLKCIDLTNNQHQDCQKGKSSFHCKYCTQYTCLKCKHVYDHCKSLCCDNCDRWIHIGCAKITEQEYKKWHRLKSVTFGSVVPHTNINEILLLHSSIMVILSNK